MATVKKLDKSKWEVRYYSYDTQGKRHQRRKQFSRAFAASLDSSAPYEASFATFDAWIEQWSAAYSPRPESTTASAYRRIVNHRKLFIGSKKLASVTASDLEQFCTIVTQPDNPVTTAPLSAATVQRHRAVLHRALKYAVRDGLIPSNPLDRVDPPKAIRKEISLPDLNQLQQRVNNLVGTPLHLPVCIALLTGMRRSEIMGLQWDCVHFDQHTLSVRRVRQRLTKKELQQLRLNQHTHPVNLPGAENNILRDCTKSKHDRTISIPQSLVDLLKQGTIDLKPTAPW